MKRLKRTVDTKKEIPVQKKSVFASEDIATIFEILHEITGHEISIITYKNGGVSLNVSGEIYPVNDFDSMN